jgi:hypothetical protein
MPSTLFVPLKWNILSISFYITGSTDAFGTSSCIGGAFPGAAPLAWLVYFRNGNSWYKVFSKEKCG